MKTIWKFPLSPADEQAISMPEGARVLSVQVQKDTLCLWALVDEEAPAQDVVVYICGTGHPADVADHATFIGTVQMLGGSLVWHVFVGCGSEDQTKAN